MEMSESNKEVKEIKGRAVKSRRILVFSIICW
jgi:hypothetical protein